MTPTTYQLEKEIAALKAENKALREAARALLDGLRNTAILHWPECDEAREHRRDGCGLIPMQQVSLDGHVSDVCDPCADRLLGARRCPPVCMGDLPHAAPLRALRKLLEAP